ncbi:hypothetical protein A2U01_0118123, partial [Trifolium medium]|nr:hypothetical protein [Trifolium medium]
FRRAGEITEWHWHWQWQWQWREVLTASNEQHLLALKELLVSFILQPDIFGR